jgi:surface protein
MSGTCDNGCRHESHSSVFSSSPCFVVYNTTMIDKNSSVTDMNSMFYSATSFTSDLSSWSIESVIDMGSMFERASSFSSSLYAWGNRFTSVGANAGTVKVDRMFVDSACQIDLSPANFEEGPWCSDSVMSVMSNLFG